MSRFPDRPPLDLSILANDERIRSTVVAALNDATAQVNRSRKDGEQLQLADIPLNDMQVYRYLNECQEIGFFFQDG